jgi:hypothetical protein
VDVRSDLLVSVLDVLQQNSSCPFSRAAQPALPVPDNPGHLLVHASRELPFDPVDHRKL